MNESNREKAVVLLSGGLDSTVSLVKAMQTYEIVLTLTFNYGQRAIGRELKSSHAIAQHYELKHQVIALPWLSEHLPPRMAYQDSFLVDNHDLSYTKADGSVNAQTETESIWVPNRNGLFLNIAASLAEAYKANVIVFGANADEAVNFPDNTEAFRDRLNEAFSYSTLNNVRVETPVGHLTKKEIVSVGVEFGAPLQLIWSCYEAGPVQCGVCPSCRLLKKAIAQESELDKPLVKLAFKA